MLNIKGLISRRVLSLLSFAVFLAMVAGAAMTATLPLQGHPHAGKVVMVVIPATSLQDFASNDLPTLHGLLDVGAVGLMNARTAGSLDYDPGEFSEGMYTPESGFVTLGAGALALVGFDARKAYNRDELADDAPAVKVLHRLTLIDPKSSEVVQPYIVSLRHDNIGLGYNLTPGLLGKLIHASGLKTAVVGNSDSNLSPHREIVSISMDENGLVDYGNVGESLMLRDASAPLSARTNSTALLSESTRCVKLADFTVIELGDTARLDRARLDMLDSVYQVQHGKILKETDRLLGELLSSIDKNTTLVILSPYPSSFAVETTDDSLCPVLVVGPGIGHGLLISGSTRNPGVLSSIDIGPSVLGWLGLSLSPKMVGRQLATTDKGDMHTLLGTEKRITLQNISQSVLSESAFASIVLIGIITALWFMIPIGSRLRKLLPVVTLWITTFAPAMLLLGAFPVGSHAATWTWLLLVSIVLCGIALLVGRKPVPALMFVCLVTSMGLLIDQTTGYPFSKYSVMGYSVMEGARYYGIGNELMGTLIGASMVALGLVLASFRVEERAIRIVLVIGLIIEAAIIGFPELGANVGGMIAVVFGFGFALAVTSKKPLSPGRILLIVIGVAAAVGLIAVFDTLRGHGHETHLGRAISQIRAGGIGQMILIIVRKMSMNIRLIRGSVWGRLVASYVISLAIILMSGKLYKRLWPTTIQMRVMLAGTVAGTLAALAFNDSGIVAAGTCFVYMWALIMLLALGVREGDQAARG